MDITPLIFDHLKAKFTEIKITLLKTLHQLDDLQVNWRPNDQSNSIANLVVHIKGNIDQRIGSALLGHVDERNRDSEFNIELYVSRDDLIEIVTDSFDLALNALANLGENDLFTIHHVRDNRRTTYDMLAQCVAHYSEHLGQTLYIAKMCLGEDYQTTSIYNPIKTMKVDAVIFDLDNTLINRNKAFRKFAEQFIERFVVTSSPQHTKDMITYIEKEDQNGYRRKKELYTQLLEQFEMKDPDITVDELLQFWFSEFSKHTVLMDGAIEVLDSLRTNGIKIGLITNGSAHSQHLKIDEVGIKDYFDVIIVSDEVGMKKPDKLIFDLALNKLNVSSESACYVGDHPINDVKGAKDAGLNTIWLQGFMDWEESVEQPDATISELSELLKIVEVIT